MQKLKIPFLCLNEDTEIPSLCVIAQWLRVGSFRCSCINWQWRWNSRENIFSCLYSKKKSWGHSLLLFVSEYFCILYLRVFQRDLFCSAAQPDEGWLGNMSQNFITIVYLLCSNQGFPVQEQCSDYQATVRAVVSSL